MGDVAIIDVDGSLQCSQSIFLVKYHVVAFDALSFLFPTSHSLIDKQIHTIRTNQVNDVAN